MMAMSRRDVLKFKGALASALGAWSVKLDYFDVDVDLICVTARLDLRRTSPHANVFPSQLRVHNYIPVDDINLPDYGTVQAVELFKRLCDEIAVHPLLPRRYTEWRDKMIEHIRIQEGLPWGVLRVIKPDGYAAATPQLLAV